MRSQERVQTILQSDLTKRAILYHLRHARVRPSHDFAHAHQVAVLATEEAAASGIRGSESLQNVFIAALFHDAVRSSKRVNDNEGTERSAQMVERFCKQNKLSPAQTQTIASIIRDSYEQPLGRYVEYADAVYFLQHSRIQSFTREHPQLRERIAVDVLPVYQQKYAKKIGRLPLIMQKKLDQVAKRATGMPARTLGESAFHIPLHDQAKKTKIAFKAATQERFHGFVDLASILALTHARNDPAFVKELYALTLKRARTTGYGKQTEHEKARLAELGRMIEGKHRVITLPQRRINRVRHELGVARRAQR